jgi:transmembrane sensor
VRRAPAADADVDVEAALRRVRERRDAADVLPFRPPHRTPAEPAARPAASSVTSRWRLPALSALAAAALLLVAVLAWQGTRDPAGNPRTVATAVGERDSLRLPDGSRVLLGPESRLVVAGDFGTARRDVELRGEAFFDVVHDDRRPFVVHAGGAAVRDVGTAFTVRAVAGGVRVVVTEGAVLLGAAAGADTAGVLLRAGDRGELRPGGPPAVARGAATDDDLAWTRGRLVFREAPMDEVAATLRRWYGVTLRVEDSALARRHLTADFAGEPVARVLDVLALALGAEVERRGDSASVRPAAGVPPR